MRDLTLDDSVVSEATPSHILPNYKASPRVQITGVPYPIEASAVPPGAVAAGASGKTEFIVLNEQNAACLSKHRLGFARTAICPTIDATRHNLDGKARPSWHDMTIPAASATWISEALTVFQDAIARLRSLPEEVLETDDPRIALLARLYVRDRGLEPRRDPNEKDTVSYSDQAVIPQVVEHAEELVRSGLLERSFFDTLTLCPRCESGRLSVREHCVHCSSRNLVTQPVLHHLRCAYQGPEAEFRRGGDLVCPKCSRTLEHFSVDYDRPGTVAVCRTCGRSCDDAAVVFLCLDCDAETPTEDCGERTVYRYALAPGAEDYLRSGARLPPPGEPLQHVRERVMRFITRESECGRPFCVLRVRLTLPDGVSASSKSWSASCALYSSLLRECFVQEVEIVETFDVFLALIPGDSKEDLEAAIPEIRDRTERFLRQGPRADYVVFGPEDAPRLAMTG